MTKVRRGTYHADSLCCKFPALGTWTVLTNRHFVSQLLPCAVSDFELSGAWTGIMPFSRDGRPIVGQLAPSRAPGIWLSMGFGPHGIMEGPAAGYSVGMCAATGSSLSTKYAPLLPHGRVEANIYEDA